jgi:hypothetical protein
MSEWLTRLLIVEYIVIMVACLVEQKYAFAVYWFGAAVLNTAVLFMAK